MLAREYYEKLCELVVSIDNLLVEFKKSADVAAEEWMNAHLNKVKGNGNNHVSEPTGNHADIIITKILLCHHNILIFLSAYLDEKHNIKVISSYEIIKVCSSLGIIAQEVGEALKDFRYRVQVLSSERNELSQLILDLELVDYYKMMKALVERFGMLDF